MEDISIKYDYPLMKISVNHRKIATDSFNQLIKCMFLYGGVFKMHLIPSRLEPTSSYIISNFFNVLFLLFEFSFIILRIAAIVGFRISVELSIVHFSFW